MTNDLVPFCSGSTPSKSPSPYPLLFSPSSFTLPLFPSKIHASTPGWPSRHLFFPSLTPVPISPISAPRPFPVACSCSLFFIHQTSLHVLTLCWDLRAARLGYCCQETFLTSYFIVMLQLSNNIRLHLGSAGFARCRVGDEMLCQILSARTWLVS